MTELGMAASFAFIHHKYGDETLRMMLNPESIKQMAMKMDFFAAEDLTSFTYTHEELVEAADELSAMGLGRVADIVLEAAADLPPKSQRNPFDPVTDGALHRDWQRRECGDWSGFMLSDQERIAKGKAMGWIK